MKLHARCDWQTLGAMLVCIAVLNGCDSKPQGSTNVTTKDPAQGSDEAKMKSETGKLVAAPVAEGDLAFASDAEEQAKESEEPENPQDADDDGIPDTAHVFDIPEGDNEVLLQFISEVPGRMLVSEDEEKGGLAITTAAERILKNNPTESQRRQAAEAMFTWLQRLQAMYAREADNVHLYWKLRLKDFEETEDESLAKLVAPYRIMNQAIGWHELRQDQRDEFALQLPGYFEKRALDDDDLATAQEVAEAILKSGDRPAAIAMYQTLAEVFQKSPDAEIAAEADRLRGMAYRLESLGQEIDFKAMTIDGKKVDWNSYRGKVVLIDFWATWCPPCLAEMPNIRKLYEIYHERGFDVIAVSLDDDEESVKDFVKDNEIPWTVTYSFQEDARGRNQPLAMQFGINSIPVALLVDQEGRLIALEARGDDLAAWLENLLGPADVASAAVSSETPEASAPKEETANDPSEEKPEE